MDPSIYYISKIYEFVSIWIHLLTFQMLLLEQIHLFLEIYQFNNLFNFRILHIYLFIIYIHRILKEKILYLIIDKL